MTRKNFFVRFGVFIAAAVLAVAGQTGQAAADSANINNFPSLSSCDVGSPYYFCLYYSPGHTGGAWRSRSSAVREIGGRFTGGAGDGQLVRNNAASADNGTNCHIGIWVSPGYTGDSNWIIQGNRGGNLTNSSPHLRNNEASIAVADSTNCPGLGIG